MMANAFAFKTPIKLKIPIKTIMLNTFLTQKDVPNESTTGTGKRRQMLLPLKPP
jgi:hypothetical protein